MVNFADTATEAKNNNNGNSANESAVASSDEHPNRTSRNDTRQEDESRKKRQRDRKKSSGRSLKRRRYSISKAARDPRDEASATEPEPGAQSPSPVIDFDGLSRPSKFFDSVCSSRMSL
jgi:GTP cyclohydrolase I